MTSVPFYPPPSRALAGLTIPRSRPSSSHKSPTDCTSPGSESSQSWRKRADSKTGKLRKPSFLTSASEQASSSNSGATTPEQIPEDKAIHQGSLAAAVSQQQGGGQVYSVSTSSSGTSGSFMSSLPSSSGSKQVGGRSTDTDANKKGNITPPSPGGKSKPAASPISRTPSSSNIFAKRKPTGTSDSPRRPSTASTSRSFASASVAASTTGGRLGSRLPQGLFFDSLRSNEVSAAHKLELATYDPIDDAASFDAFKYRMSNAPHLFYGAFLPLPPPKVSGPLSMSGPRPRKLIGFVCGTAASAYTARSFKCHQDDEDAWLVCVHSIVVAKDCQRKGLASKLLEEYMKRLRKAEEGKGGKDGLEKRGYECVAVLAHENMVPLFEKASFKRFRVSHVTSGTGEWIEMRRKIAYTDEDEAEDESAVLSPASCESSGFLPPRTPRTPPSATTATVTQESATPTERVEMQATTSTSQLGEKAAAAWMTGVDEQTSSPTEIVTPDVLRGTDPFQMTLTPAAAPEKPKEPSESMTGSVASLAGEPKAAPFSQAQLLAALQSQSKANKDNTGIAYSQIMGQTLASKTSVEDAFYALEARLVNREDMTNLADLLCPKEDCGCVILREGTSDWEMAELGPLATGESAASMPQSVAPPLKNTQRIRNVFGAPTPTTKAKVGTPPRPFWIVQSPMIFDNISFSRDVEWAPPPPSRTDSDASEDKKASTSEGPRGMRRRLTESSSSFFKSVGKRDRGASESTSPTSPLSSVLSRITKSNANNTDASTTSAAQQSNARQTRADSTSSDTPQLKVTIKYLMCAECDYGPIGYTVLPHSLQGGQFASEVGKQTQEHAQRQDASADSRRSGSSERSRMGTGSPQANAGSSSPTHNVLQQAAQAKPFYYVAADRVRYRFPKS